MEKETINKEQVEELFKNVAKRPQREPDVRSAGLAVSRSAVRKQGVKHAGPGGLRG
jgi:hypothetical protein